MFPIVNPFLGVSRRFVGLHKFYPADLFNLHKLAELAGLAFSGSILGDLLRVFPTQTIQDAAGRRICQDGCLVRVFPNLLSWAFLARLATI